MGKAKSLADLLKNRKPGHSLDQQLYLDPAIFSEDMKRVYSRHWVLVDHVSRVAEVGSYFVVNLGGEEIIVVRESEDKVNAFYNVCRHRGARLCQEASGNKRLLVCPYHNWSYKLDGSLNGARLMPDSFDPKAHGLHCCHIKIFGGLIFLCTANENAPEFDAKPEIIAPFMEFHDIESAKIATRKVYRVHANWKLVVENFSECYHCNAVHPELCSVHLQSRVVGFGGGPGSGSPEDEKAFLSEVATWAEKAQAMGHPTGILGNQEHPLGFPMVSRFPFKNGFKSESENGQPVSRLMGACREYDGGTTGFGWNVWSWAFSANDYTVLFRFSPVNENQTDCESIWLVHPESEEGVDYDLDKLMWAWDSTLEQDTIVIENNNAGVMSQHYQPGPYSLAEAAVDGFDKWYIDSLSSSLKRSE